MHKFRHYIYGLMDDGDDFFITTTLSLDDAEKFVQKHRQVFRDRFKQYSIRVTDIQVKVV